MESVPVSRTKPGPESASSRGDTARAAFLALFSMLAAAAVWKAPAIGAWYSDPFRGTTISREEFDPAQLVKETVRLPRLDDRGRIIPRRTPVLLVPAPCGSCVNPRTWTRSLQAGPPAPTIAVLAGPDRMMEAAIRSDTPAVFQIGSRSRAGLPPRLPAIAPLFAASDSGGRIVAVSRPGESLPAFWERTGLR